MADEWIPVGGAAPKDEWLPVGGRAPETTTDIQEQRDRELVEAAKGVVPEEIKTGAYNALNAAGFNVPSHVVAALTKVQTGRPYEEVYKEQKEYEEALSRRSPTASKVGTGLGIAGGMFVPMGALGRAGQLAKAAVAPKYGAVAGKAAELGAAGGVGAGLSGLSTGIETLDPSEAAKSAVIGGGLGAGLQAAVGPLTKAFGKVRSPLDEAGAPTQETRDVIRRALGDKLSADDLAKFEPEIVDQMVKAGKGPSEASAIEAFLTASKVPTGASMVTGAKPAKAAEELAVGTKTAAEEALAKRATEAFPTKPWDTSVAEDLRKAAETAKGRASSEFDAARNLEVEFAEHVQNQLFPMMEMKMEGLMPSRSGKIERFPNLAEGAEADRFPGATKAYEYIKGLSNPDPKEKIKLPYSNDPLNAANVIEIGKKLNAFRQGASADDKRVIDAIRRSYQESIQSAVESGLYTGFGRELLEKWKSGNKLWNQYAAQYNPRLGGGAGVMKSIMSHLVDENGNLRTVLPQDIAITAQGAINSGLMHPKLGTTIYGKIEHALGKDSPTMNQIKSNIRTLAFGDTSDISKLPKKIDMFLESNRGLAQRVFTPDEITEMRRLSAAIKIVNKAPASASERESQIAQILQRAGSIGAGIIGSTFHGFPGAIIGAGLAEAAGAGARAGVGAFQRAGERAGAPKVKDVPGFLMNAPVRNLEAFEPVERAPDYEALPLRPGRATGGRIDSHETIANRLVSMADQAKKDINKNTEVLLNTPDTHVAQALEVANRQIEG